MGFQQSGEIIGGEMAGKLLNLTQLISTKQQDSKEAELLLCLQAVYWRTDKRTGFKSLEKQRVGEDMKGLTTTIEGTTIWPAQAGP